MKKKSTEGQSSMLAAYAYGISIAAMAIGVIWFQRFWSDMYDRVFPKQ